MRIIAKALIINQNNEILVLRRSSTHPNFPFHYDFPGGETKDNEDNTQVVVREILEETGLRILPASLELVYQKEIPGTDTKNVLFKTQIDNNKQNISISWEHDLFLWLKPADIIRAPKHNNLDPFYVTALEYIKQIV